MRTLLGPVKVFILERCPHFRGELIHDPIAQGLYKGVLNYGGFCISGSPHFKGSTAHLSFPRGLALKLCCPDSTPGFQQLDS